MNAPHLPAVTRPDSIIPFFDVSRFQGSVPQTDADIELSMYTHTCVAACSSNVCSFDVCLSGLGFSDVAGTELATIETWIHLQTLGHIERRVGSEEH